MEQDQVWIPYCGAAPAPAELLGRWNFDPPLLFALFLIVVATFQIGDPRRRLAMAGATGLLFLLYVSPFCALTSALFAARVTHHVVLTAVIAPLIAMSLPRARIDPPFSLPFWTMAQAFVFWAWHAPQLYAAALSDPLFYWLMQLSMLGTALGFWIMIWRSTPLKAVAGLLATMVQMGLLGALITFNAAPIYEPHFESSWAWGFSPLEDQQLAGLIMWAPSAGLYLAAALLVTARWFRSESEAVAG